MKRTKKSLERKVEYLVYLLIVNFIVILSQIFIPFVSDILNGGMLFLLPFISFSILGFVLVYLVRKAGIQGKLRRDLNLTGYSAGLIFVSVFLHNIISAIGILLLHKDFEEPVFFILATIILPILFVFGTVNSILAFKQK